MFYVYFLIIIFLVFLIFWIGLWLYKILTIKHIAHSLLGKLIRLYDKRIDILEKFINRNIVNADLYNEVSKITGLIIRSKNCKDIYIKLKIEHDISEIIKSFNFEFNEDINDIHEEIHKIVDEYNKLAERLKILSNKVILKNLFKIFKIATLDLIEV